MDNKIKQRIWNSIEAKLSIGASTSKEDKSALEKALQSMGSCGYVILDADTQFLLLQSGNAKCEYCKNVVLADERNCLSCGAPNNFFTRKRYRE